MDLRDLTIRVATRYSAQKKAEAIGNPANLIRQFESTLGRYAELEAFIPQMREAEGVIARGEVGNPEHRDLLRFYSSHKYDFSAKVVVGYQAFQRSGGHLFLALLQQFEFPAKLRKDIEAIAKFYSKGRVQRPGKGKDIEIYEKYLTAYRSQLELAKTAMAQGKPHGSMSEDNVAGTKLQAGPFIVVNTGGFSPEVMQEVAGAAEKAASLLARKGLQKVCYGEILISNRLAKSTTLAFYLPQQDELFVRADLKGRKAEAIRDILHELGHRLHLKFLNSKDRDIQRIYLALGHKDRMSQMELVRDPTLRPEPGETITEKGKTYKVTKVVYDKVYLENVANAGQATMPLVSWIRLKGTAPGKASHFVTPYAGKNHEENFAEMLSFYCLDELPPDQVEMLESVL